MCFEVSDILGLFYSQPHYVRGVGHEMKPDVLWRYNMQDDIKYFAQVPVAPAPRHKPTTNLTMLSGLTKTILYCILQWNRKKSVMKLFLKRQGMF